MTPEERETSREIAEWAATNLPFEQFEALQLWLEGNSYKEIANLQGVSISTAKSRVRLALEKLRGRFEQ